MDAKYKKVHDFLTTAKVLCTFIAVVYVVYWFLLFLNFPFIGYLTPVFDPPVGVLRTFVTWDMHYNGVNIDMLPILCAIIFQILYFILENLAHTVEKAENKHKLNVIEEKKLEEKLVNENLKEIFKAKTMEYKKFALYISLNLENIVDAQTRDFSSGLENITQKEYIKIVNAVRKKYSGSKAITPDKLFILYDNFSLFDDFLTDILKEIKVLTELNAQKNVRTNFLILIDALKEHDKVTHTLDMFEKIATFNYTNKVITTGSFNLRYNMNPKNKYILETMGISRFFDNNKNGAHKSVDFELFCLKNPKRKNAFNS